MSLADQIADKQSSSPSSDVDEFGIPIPTPETPEYWVARALLIHNNDRPDYDYSINCLHLRGDTLYLNHTPLEETSDTIYRLTRLRHPIKVWERVAFYAALKQYVPRFRRDFIQIAPDLYWDYQTAELIDHKKLNERIK